MCELFAMSSRWPTSVGFSLERLARRGGDEGPHRDGWGVAYYADTDVTRLREPGAASESGLARFIERNGPSSDLVISHIRLATFGVPALRNTQPFARELGGRMHVFAHNGDLHGLHVAGGSRFRPLGETDSEVAFCKLLTVLQDLWSRADGAAPGLAQRLHAISGFAAQCRQWGTANFLYADGDALFVHADYRTPPGQDIRMPGLHVLERNCEEAVPDLSGSGVLLKSERQALVLVASVPLTEEAWRPLARGELLVIRQGEIAGDAASRGWKRQKSSN